MSWLEEWLRRWRSRPAAPVFTRDPEPFGVWERGAGVEWATSTPTQGLVTVLTEPPSGPSLAVADENWGRIHQRTVEPLAPGTAYRAVVTAWDSRGREIAGECAFVTPPVFEPAPEPPPPPAPTPDPEPSPAPLPGGFTPPPLSAITWHDQDVSGWAVTSPIDEAAAEWRDGRQHFPHPRADAWPPREGGDLNANPWVIFQHGGAWHAMTWEWCHRGQTTKGLAADRFHAHLSDPGRVPGWPGPQSGEWCGWLVTSVARHGYDTGVHERSQVCWRMWP